MISPSIMATSPRQGSLRPTSPWTLLVTHMDVMVHTVCPLSIHPPMIPWSLTVEHVHSETSLCTGCTGGTPEVMARMRSVGIRKGT
jgi:hypothetical protein